MFSRATGSYRCRALLLAFALMAPGGTALHGQVDDFIPSPDGTKALLVTFVEPDYDIGGRGVINLLHLDPVTKVWGPPVVIVSEGDSGRPQWSPDGSKILFQSYRYEHSDFGSDIFVVDADGSDEVNLTNHPAQDSDAWWSPDGTRIAFTSDRDRDEDMYWSGLWVMDADGGSPVRITNLTGAGYHPWLDNDTLQFVVDGVYYTAYADGSAEPQPTFPPPPRITPSSVVLATLAPQQSVLSPLSLASVFGIGLATSESLTPMFTEDGAISTEALGSCVKVGGVYAPILAVRGSQINFQVPAETPTGPNQVIVLRNCNGDEPEAASPPVTVSVERASPGFFRYTLMIAAARFADGVPVAHNGMIQDELGRVSRPAQAGDIISVYGTGWGPTTKSTATGELVLEAAALLPEANPMVKLGGFTVPAENILYIGAAPGAAGLYQLNMIVPSLPGIGDRNIELTVYGKSSPVGPAIPVATR